MEQLRNIPVSIHTFKLLLIESKEELWKDGFGCNRSKRFKRLNSLIFKRFKH